MPTTFAPAAAQSSRSGRFWRSPRAARAGRKPFADDIRSFACEERDVVDQAALLWNVIHTMILEYQETFPDWIYLRHEDLWRDPVAGFRSLFERLDLDLREPTRAAIVAHSDAAGRPPTHAERTIVPSGGLRLRVR